MAILVMWTLRFGYGGSKWDLVTIGPVAFEEMFEIVILWESWIKGQTMALTASTHKS